MSCFQKFHEITDFRTLKDLFWATEIFLIWFCRYGHFFRQKSLILFGRSKRKKCIFYFGLRIMTAMHLQYSRVERFLTFLNLHLAHPNMDSGWKSKTKIEKAFFIIFSSFCSRLVFVKKNWPKPLNKVWNYFLKKWHYGY